MTETYKACIVCRRRLRSALGETIICGLCEPLTPDERDAVVAARVRRVGRAKAGGRKGG